MSGEELRPALHRAYGLLREAERDAETAGIELRLAAAASCYARLRPEDVARLEEIDRDMRAAEERASWFRRGVRLLEARLGIVRDTWGNNLSLHRGESG